VQKGDNLNYRMNGTKCALTMKDLFVGKTVIVGIGNILHGDDGLGPYLVDRLKKRIVVPCINAECSLDRYIGKIAREDPDTVVLVDAVHLNEKPGSVEILEPEELVDTRTSTHDLTPSSTVEILKQVITGEVYLLGIQPACVRLGAKISRRVKKAIRRLERRIVKTVKRRAAESVRW
jgi:hydrogenase maturation protease